jgi:putative phosphoribosyl transferase
MEKYRDRQAAGQILAEGLKEFAHRADVLVLALPRGGVPVAFEIAQDLHAPIDVFIVRKLGVPGHTELAMGAIAMGGVTVFNEAILREMDIDQASVDAVIAAEKIELTRRENSYRGNHVQPIIKNKNIILVDDGIATGATMRAAIQALRKLQPQQIIVAVPVVDMTMVDVIASQVERFICPLKVTNLDAVGAWYEDFSQTTDHEVQDLLTKGRQSSNLG